MAKTEAEQGAVRNWLPWRGALLQQDSPKDQAPASSESPGASQDAVEKDPSEQQTAAASSWSLWRNRFSEAKTALKSASWQAVEGLMSDEADVAASLPQTPASPGKGSPNAGSQRSGRDVTKEATARLAAAVTSSTPWSPKSQSGNDDMELLEQRIERRLRSAILRLPEEDRQFYLVDADWENFIVSDHGGDVVKLLDHMLSKENVDEMLLVRYAESVLEVDTHFRRIRFDVVPRKVDEESFLRRYFQRVRLLRRKLLLEEALAMEEERQAIAAAACIGCQKSEEGGEGLSSKRSSRLDMTPSRRCAVQLAPEELQSLAAAVGAAKAFGSLHALALSELEDIPQPEVAAAVAGVPSTVDDEERGVGHVLLRAFGTGRVALRQLGSAAMAAAVGRRASLLELDGGEKEQLYKLFDPLQPCSTAVELDDDGHIAEDIALKLASAPADGLLAIMSSIFSELGSASRMASFWLEMIDEIEWHWHNQYAIPRLPEEETPDHRLCLVHQKLQQLNCCVARRLRRERRARVEEASRKHILDQSSPEAAATPCRRRELFAKHRIGCIGQVGDKTLLSTGDRMYAPATQEAPVLTEDVARETEEFLLKDQRRSVGQGAQQLQSDIAAFKAANPGSQLSDFVRWHSPQDWLVEMGECETDGRLSARMSEAGSLWGELWDSTAPEPAGSQTPIFDDEHVAMEVLSWLRNIAPSELFETIFIIALSSSLTATLGTAAVKQAAKMTMTPDEVVEQVAQHVGRGMSQSKIGTLCDMYSNIAELVSAAASDSACETTK